MYTKSRFTQRSRLLLLLLTAAACSASEQAYVSGAAYETQQHIVYTQSTFDPPRLAVAPDGSTAYVPYSADSKVRLEPHRHVPVVVSAQEKPHSVLSGLSAQQADDADVQQDVDGLDMSVDSLMHMRILLSSMALVFIVGAWRINVWVMNKIY